MKQSKETKTEVLPPRDGMEDSKFKNVTSENHSYEN